MIPDQRVDGKGKSVVTMRYFVDGVEVTEKEYDALLATPVLERKPPRGKKAEPKAPKRNAKWPLKSKAAGVHKSLAGKAAEHAAKLGVPTEFTPTGEAVFRDRGHRRAFLKAHGMVDHDGGYGDG